jgi:hypothetical protein
LPLPWRAFILLAQKNRTKKTHRCHNFVMPLGGSWFGLALRAAPLGASSKIKTN